MRQHSVKSLMRKCNTRRGRGLRTNVAMREKVAMPKSETHRHHGNHDYRKQGPLQLRVVDVGLVLINS